MLVFISVVLVITLAVSEHSRSSWKLRAEAYERALKASRCKCQQLHLDLDTYKDRYDNVIALHHRRDS